MSIGIVGTGIAGLHLALRLQQAGVDTTLYGEKSADAMRSGPMLNTVARFGHTRRREQALGLPDLPARTTATRLTVHHSPAIGNPELSFEGSTGEPWSFVDMRIVQADALETYLARGGRFQVGSLSDEDLAALGGEHELVVVGAGRRGLDALFPVDPQRTPYDGPQRRLTAMFATGLDTLPEATFGYHIVPGVGELFQPAFTTADGDTAGLLFEGIPGGPFAELAALDRAADPAAFDKLALRLLQEFTPDVAELADPASFGVRGDGEVLQGAIAPKVRRPASRLPSGTWALAVGDAWVTNDPVTGQGANTASFCASVVADAILAGGPYDEAFCRRAADAMWAFTGPVTDWTNATLGPPPDHVLGVFATAAADRRVADALIGQFNDPPAMWAALSSPGGAAEFLSRSRGQAPAGAPA